jgi:ubiquinone/menaquinone biosynthesis C-methylase UbiE
MTESKPRRNARSEQRRLVQRNFGAVAAAYVTSRVHASGADLDWLVEAAALTGTQRVLDVATGGGHTAFALAPYAVEVVALDFTRPMLEVAQREAVARGLSMLRFLEGDAQALPCKDASFEVVTCRHAAHHFPQVDRAVREWARVLTPAGKLLLVDSISPEEEEAQALLHDIEVLRDPSHVRSHRMAQWLALLAQAGFTVDIARAWGVDLDLLDWTQRMRTPPAVVAVIEQRLRDASPEARTRLCIAERDGMLGFTLPVALLRARKAA